MQNNRTSPLNFHALEQRPACGLAAAKTSGTFGPRAFRIYPIVASLLFGISIFPLVAKAAPGMPVIHNGQDSKTTNEVNGVSPGGRPGANEKEVAALADEVKHMRELIERLQKRVNQLEAERPGAPGSAASGASLRPGAAEPAADAEQLNSTKEQTLNPNVRQRPLEKTSGQGTRPTDEDANQINSEEHSVLNFLRDTTFNMTFDGYYAYNFNRPVGRINLLRAYDVSSNSFSLNQAAVIIENAPNVSAGRRFGLRLDLQYGQATETLQGSAANEPRPQVYRPVFQAYGTYVAPLGKGLTIDFGKFASSLGIEGNYTKDQINYSRSYYYNFLPFYHFGFRANYAFNDKFNATYWLVNGINQSEGFNGFKSQALILNFQPTKQVSLYTNYFTGIQNRDNVPALNPGISQLPTQPGLSTNIIRPVPRGKTHIFDAYITYNATTKLTLAGEADYVVARMFPNSFPSHVDGGAIYARYQVTPKFAVAGRGEYLSDRGGLFSGVTQALKETTFTGEYKLAEGFLVRGEYRRDFSNQPFFLTNIPGLLKREQNTASLGMVWWIGRKQSPW